MNHIFSYLERRSFMANRWTNNVDPFHLDKAYEAIYKDARTRYTALYLVREQGMTCI